MKKNIILFAAIGLLLGYDLAPAKVDLVVLPKRDTVQLTIYNSADLTLVREKRALTLKTGLNRLQFSWANTLIDPTSLDMLPAGNADKIDILDLTFPPRVSNLGLWHVQSRTSGEVPVEINYLTSGLSWRAFYMGTLSTDEKSMRLQGYVRVTNSSGEGYENARVRMIVGKIHLIDSIADLARRKYPYGRPGLVPKAPMAKAPAREEVAKLKRAYMRVEEKALARPKDIKKEGLSEYFLYTIEGTENIPNRWSKRMPSFSSDGVPVVNLYKYEAERYGTQVMRFLSFKNDEEHNLGDTPIPGGTLKVYRNLDESDHLSYEAQSQFKYIPVDEDIELSLGTVANVMVKPTLMDFKTDRYLFDHKGNISGWDETRTFEVEVKNTREIPIKAEVTRNFNAQCWDLTKSGAFGKFEKVDLDTVKFTLMLHGHETKRFRYVLTTHHGKRAD